MIKKSNFIYLTNLINYNFKIGEVIKIFYIIRKRNKRRIYNIIGLCLFKNKNNFIIFNKLKKEKIQFIFTIFSPAILKIFIVKMYKPFIFRISKIYFKKNLFLKEDFYFLNVINSSINSYFFDFVTFLGVRRVGRRIKKKLRAKYRYRNIINYKEFDAERDSKIDYEIYNYLESDICSKNLNYYNFLNDIEDNQNLELNKFYVDVAFNDNNTHIDYYSKNKFIIDNFYYISYFNSYLLKIKNILFDTNNYDNNDIT